jgi:hypothetical protein
MPMPREQTLPTLLLGIFAFLFGAWAAELRAGVWEKCITSDPTGEIVFGNCSGYTCFPSSCSGIGSGTCGGVGGAHGSKVIGLCVPNWFPSICRNIGVICSGGFCDDGYMPCACATPSGC